MQIAARNEQRFGTERLPYAEPTFNWPKEARLLHGRLEDSTTGEVYDVASGDTDDTVMVSKTSPNHPFKVMTVATTPIYKYGSLIESALGSPKPSKAPEYQYRSPHASDERKQRARLEEHRERVIQLRREIGDVESAIAAFSQDFLGDQGMAILSDWTDQDLRKDDENPLADHAR